MHVHNDMDTDDRFAFEKMEEALGLVDEGRIAAAVTDVREFLDVESLAGYRFVDVGSGSGLSSLAARRLGASVTSFDFDAESVACTRELRERYDIDGDWRIEEGSILDRAYIDSLGQLTSFTRGACFTIRAHFGQLSTTPCTWLRPGA